MNHSNLFAQNESESAGKTIFPRKQQLLNWFVQMPPESKERLRQINSHTGSAQHVILALAFGVCDQNIGRLNRLIIAMLLARLRAERHGDSVKSAAIASYMKDMHEVIDSVTGVDTAVNGDRHACNRVSAGRTKSGLNKAS